MTTQLRPGIVPQQPPSTFSGEVACEEVSIVAGHKGQPAEVANKGASADAGASRGRGDVAPAQASNHRASACSNAAQRG
jgi:hypothetical protein